MSLRNAHYLPFGAPRLPHSTENSTCSRTSSRSWAPERRRDPSPQAVAERTYTLGLLEGHIHLSVKFDAARPADRTKLGWAVPPVPVPGCDAVPLHIDVTLLGSPGEARLRWIASDAPLARAQEAGGADALSYRRRRSSQARLEALATADRQRAEFLAVLSHELRSPLAAMHNAVHIVGSPATEAPARRRAQALLERQLQRVMRLVDDILDSSQRAFGRVPLNYERMDLRTAVSSAVETLETEIHERHHRLTVALPCTPVWVQGDARRLEQVFVNVLANACKFTDVGGELLVRLHTADGQAMVQFTDSGIGIEAQALPYIFEPFRQTDEGARRSDTALGVGLALVREFVEAHGGSVTARSAGPGRGSEFTVQLPSEG